MGRAVIIGSGLGGLECGLILARSGWSVTILEQGAQIGGCLQSYSRRGTRFDTGFHHVGGLGEGESLHGVFESLGLMDLPWVRMDSDCVDEIVIGSRTFRMPQGYARVEEYLISEFPGEADGIRRYVQAIKAITDGIEDIMLPSHDISATGVSAYGFLHETFHDELLIRLLSSMTSRMQYDAEMTPLYEYAQITGSFMQSGWRLRGTGEMVAEKLARQTEALGGQILTGCRAVAVEAAAGPAVRVTAADGRVFEGDACISDAHPAVTMGLIGETGKKFSGRRICSLRDSRGALTVSIRLKGGMVPYVNHSIFIHPSDVDTWHGTGSAPSVLVSFGVPSEGRFARTVDLMTEADFKDFEAWEGTSVGRRGEDYVACKERLAARCIDVAAQRIEGLRVAIDGAYVSTPLTYRDYTLTRNGSAFGFMKDCRSPMTTFLSPKTPMENLFMTGQSLNLHGMLGVSLTALYTCAEILGAETVRREAGLERRKF